MITGLTRGSTAAQVARATQELIAYQIRDVFETMQAEAGMPLQVLLVDGGATRNQALMQFQADILGVPVLRSLASDVSALGAAYLAGLTVGIWASEAEIAALSRPHVRYEPAMDDAQRERLVAGWTDAIGRVLWGHEFASTESRLGRFAKYKHWIELCRDSCRQEFML